MFDETESYMKRLVIESQEQELKVLELLRLLGFEWLDGIIPKDSLPSIDVLTWKGFTFTLIIDQEENDITWEG